jgi:hypothetical protein
VPIKIGGKAYVPTEQHINAVPIEHVSFLAYDYMCRMADAREEAIRLWEAKEELLEEMEARDVSHPGYAGAAKHLSDLQGAVTNACVMYLSAERCANQCWQEVTEEKRIELKMDDMFGVEADRPDLFGLWWHQLPISYPPPHEFYMDEIALLIAIEPQKNIYERMKG